MHKGFTMDLDRCTGCRACVLACRIENELSAEAPWRRVTTFNERRAPGLPVLHYSMACNHCVDPPCAAACPARAISKDPASGAVTVDEARCLGCRYCSWICPFDAPRHDARRGVMRKCTFCAPRLAASLPPACAAACPTGALVCGDFRGAGGSADRLPGFSRQGIEPAVSVLPRARGLTPPQGALAGGPVPRDALCRLPSPAAEGLALSHEWPLVAFTFLLAVLVGAFAGSLLGGPRLPPFVFAAAGIAALGISLFHLGRPLRCLAAVRNVASSWLSREIALAAAFVAVATLSLNWPTLPFAAPLAAVLGFASLAAVDLVYGATADRRRRDIHSGGAFISGCFLTGILAANLPLAAAFGALKLGLYAARLSRRRGRLAGSRRLAAVVRVAAGLLAPLALLAFGQGNGRLVVIACAALGELIDRIELYLDLELVRPKTEVARALEEIADPSRETATSASTR